MPSKEQLVFFESLYKAENKRSEILREHAKTNTGLATFYSAFVIFVIEKLRPETWPTFAIFILTVSSLMIAFFLSLWATQIASYERVVDGTQLLRSFDEGYPTEDRFFAERMVDYAVAAERNAVVNDRKAR